MGYDPRDDSRRPIEVFAGQWSDSVSLPLWPMLHPDLSAQARCLVPLIIAAAERVYGHSRSPLVPDVASTIIGGDFTTALAELATIGFVELHDGRVRFRSSPPLGFAGPRNLGEATRHYGGAA